MTPIALPTAVVRALRDPTPEAKDLTPTRFQPAENKSWFATHYLRFVSSDCPRHQFTLRFYRQLMHCFGHIVCYDVTAQVSQRGQAMRRSSIKRSG